MGLDLLVEFEFRTTRTTGVLLGISSQKMDGMGIEMIDEKVSGNCLHISDFFMKLCSLLRARMYLFIFQGLSQLCVFLTLLFCRSM